MHYQCVFSAQGKVNYEKDPLAEAISKEERKGVLENLTTNGIAAGATVNSVTIHTPVVVSYTFSNQDEYNQKINPGAGQPLVLDKMFTLTVNSKGSHNGMPGYGEKDYSRYYERFSKGVPPELLNVPTVQVKFPFSVVKYVGSGEDLFYNANTWITVAVDNTQFLLPSWVDEGEDQLTMVRANAVNARDNDGLTKYESGANHNIKNYVAYSQALVEVVGRVYGLSIIDIADYPLWKNYFQENGVLSGEKYYSGLADQNGLGNHVKPKYTFPTISGSHPTVTNAGVLKPGYNIRLNLETVGNLFSADDYVEIKPEFYYVSKKTGKRTKVSVYYDETINGQKQSMVRIGNDLDKQNKKYLSLSSGSFGLNGTTLKETAAYQGFKTMEQFSNHESAIYTFGNMMLNQYVRTYVGKEHKTLLDKGYQSLWSVGSDTLSDTVSEKKVAISVQKWYSTYYLPSSIYVTPEKLSEAETDAYVKTALESGENPWLSDGYSPPFTIKTVNGGEYHLAYNAKDLNDTAMSDPENNADSAEQEIKVAGDCNMWTVEQFVHSKINAEGKTMKFQDGDFLVFDLDVNSADSDYGSGGTQ